MLDASGIIIPHEVSLMCTCVYAQANRRYMCSLFFFSFINVGTVLVVSNHLTAYVKWFSVQVSGASWGGKKKASILDALVCCRHVGMQITVLDFIL